MIPTHQERDKMEWCMVVSAICRDRPCFIKSVPGRRDLSFGLDVKSTESPAHSATLRVTDRFSADLLLAP